MKKFIAGLLAGVLIAAGVSVYASAGFDKNKIYQMFNEIFVGQQTLNMMDEDYGVELPVLNYNHRTYVPLRKIAEATGADSGLMWNEYTEKIHIIRYDRAVVDKSLRYISGPALYVIYEDGLNMAVQTKDGNRYYAVRDVKTGDTTRFFSTHTYRYDTLEDGRINVNGSRTFELKLLED